MPQPGDTRFLSALPVKQTKVILAFVCGDVMLGCDIKPAEPFHVGDEVHVFEGDKLRLACSSWRLWKRPRAAPRWQYTVMHILPDWWGKPLVLCSSAEVIADPAVAESAVVFFRRIGLIKIGKYDHTRGRFDMRDTGEARVE